METGQHQWKAQTSGNLLLVAECSCSPGGDKVAAPAAQEAPGSQPSHGAAHTPGTCHCKRFPGPLFRQGRCPMCGAGGRA